jgi:galactose mutarotase-like enzyme
VTTATPDPAGLSRWTLESSVLALQIVPGCGGKIVSILDRVRNREWLWQNPFLDLTRPDPDASYVEKFDSGGLDECFPAVSAGPVPHEAWQGVLIPDHGEWWTLSWEGQPQGLELDLTAQGTRFPVKVSRILRLDPERACFTLDYTLESLASVPLPCIYCMHPLFTIEPGMRIIVDGTYAPVIHGVSNPLLGGTGDRVMWPLLGPHDLSRLDPASGVAVKLWGNSPASAEIHLEHPASRSRIKMTWDARELPHLGLWINQGGWAGVPDAQPYANVGIEPGWGGVDGLEVAAHETRTAWTLEPGMIRTWSIAFAIEALA